MTTSRCPHCPVLLQGEPGTVRAALAEHVRGNHLDNLRPRLSTSAVTPGGGHA